MNCQTFKAEKYLKYQKKKKKTHEVGNIVISILLGKKSFVLNFVNLWELLNKQVLKTQLGEQIKRRIASWQSRLEIKIVEEHKKQK